MKTRVIAFGPVSDLFSEREIELTIPSTGSELKEQLCQAIPELGEYTFRIAADSALISESAVVERAQEIALLPPFAGG